MATVCAAHDLSGIGRCSLNVAISILSAMGHTCCPLPTAVLSQQTAFPGYSYCDFTDELPAFLKGWGDLAFSPSMIYTGFLGSDRQPAILANYIHEHPSATVLVDPVMADDGALYPCYTDLFVPQMRSLVSTAHIITPNVTEFLLLCGLPAHAPIPSTEECLAMIQQIDAPRLRLAAITGIHDANGAYNLLLDLESGQFERLDAHHTGISYSGTGDLFASIFCGAIAGGLEPTSAVGKAVDFISAVAQSMPDDADPRYGLRYEPFLSLLTPNTIQIGVV